MAEIFAEMTRKDRKKQVFSQAHRYIDARHLNISSALPALATGKTGDCKHLRKKYPFFFVPLFERKCKPGLARVSLLKRSTTGRLATKKARRHERWCCYDRCCLTRAQHSSCNERATGFQKPTEVTGQRRQQTNKRF